MQMQNNKILHSNDSIVLWAGGISGTPVAERFICSIETILHKDYKNLSCSCFREKNAWDADSYEIALKKGTNQTETVDFVMGLTNGQLVMVEAKLDVVNVDHLAGEIEEKIKKTKRYLVSSTTFKSCAKPSVVLFGNKKNNIQRNINKFRRLRQSKTDIIPMSLSDFYTNYFTE